MNGRRARREQPPAHSRALDQLIRNYTGERNDGDRLNARAKLTVAHTIVGQMLPSGVVKGGAALNLRLGAASRFSTDFDATRDRALDAFLDDFQRRLGEGWAGFTGVLRERPPATPPGVPARYVMRPFDIPLSYKGSRWRTLELEVGHDEVGSTDSPELLLAPEIGQLFRFLGLPDPAPVPLMPTSHQVAQKLHACTEVGNERAHDLVDIQLLVTADGFSLVETKTAARRLFASRRAQAWPPLVQKSSRWDELYEEAVSGLGSGPEEAGVLPFVDDAVSWVNKLIGRIESSAELR